jgi:anti-anti-sigma regulatory factor
MSVSARDTGSHTVPPNRVAVLNVAADLDRAGLDLLQQRCRAEIAARVTTLVIDFTEMTDFPSALFRLLTETRANLRNQNGHLYMIGLNEAFESIVGTRD